MPYTAITPFRTAVMNLVAKPYPRPADPAPSIPDGGEARRRLEFRYRGTVATYLAGDTSVPANPKTDPYTVARFTYDNGLHIADWTYVEGLDYQGGDANNPEATFGPDKEFISVIELPDGVQGNYLSGRPRGRLEVTEQIDLWHPWRVAVDDLADYICHRLDGRSIQLIDEVTKLPAPGIGTISVGVRSVVPTEAGSRMVRLSQRFIVSGHD